jgi:hypothetical protein
MRQMQNRAAFYFCECIASADRVVRGFAAPISLMTAGGDHGIPDSVGIVGKIQFDRFTSWRSYE